MFKTTLLILWIHLICSCLFAQTPPDYVCGLDDDVSPSIIRINGQKPPSSNEMFDYLEALKQLYSQPYARYELREISNNIKAA
ncbi:MAG: hypothetical protein AAF206_31965, partial [Bacteroidota bacterium]